MTIDEFAKAVAEKTEDTIARRYGITTVEVEGTAGAPLLHIVNKDFHIDRSVPAAGPYGDFEANGETQLETYAEALAFEIEYALFEELVTNKDITKYSDFTKAGEMLYTKLLDVDRSRGIFLEGAIGRKVDEYSVMILYIHDKNTKTIVNEALINTWGIQAAALFLKAAENSATYTA